MAGQMDRPVVVDRASDDLTRRMEQLPPGHPSSPYNEDGTRKPPVSRTTVRELPLPKEFSDDAEPDKDAEPAASDSPPEPDTDQRSFNTRNLTESPQTSSEATGPDTANQETGDQETGDQEGGDQEGGRGKTHPDKASGDGPQDSDPRVAEPPVAEPHRPEVSQPDSRSWWEALPRLKEQWEHHKERWPQEQRPPADRSNDEPNSWRGDSGQYLNAEENLVAGHAIERARPVEEKVTAALQEIKTQVPDCDLAGLEFRFKGEERFKEKISDELRAKPDRSIAAISDNMPDALRYTFQFDRESYVDGYWNALRYMERHGYDMESSRNSWDSAQYKGINTRWRTETGQMFEVQFHTPESFEAKQLTHEAYERIRSPAASNRERGDLYKFQNEISASVPAPSNVLTIPDYQKKER